LPISVSGIPAGNAEEVLRYLAGQIDGTPVYRALCNESLREYESHGVMTPKEGDLSVGRGVFFYINPSHAVKENKPLIVVSSTGILSRERRIVDTRIPGYDVKYKMELESSRGAGNYSGWDVWKRVLESDTITVLNGEVPVYTIRSPVTRDEILFEVRL